MSTVYLNWDHAQGSETVDEFSPEQGQTRKEFVAYVREMAANYRESGMAVRESSRPCANWKD